MTNNESNTQFKMLENEQNKRKRMKKEGFIKTNSENEFFKSRTNKEKSWLFEKSTK